MLKLLNANYLGISSGISAQFTFEMCAAPKNCEKFTKTHFLGVQGGSRSSMLINLKKPVISACYGTPLGRPRSRGTPAPRGTKFCHEKLKFLEQPTVKIS